MNKHRGSRSLLEHGALDGLSGPGMFDVSDIVALLEAAESKKAA